jgi:tetratricopeptide (TPR) repeat protein
MKVILLVLAMSIWQVSYCQKKNIADSLWEKIKNDTALKRMSQGYDGNYQGNQRRLDSGMCVYRIRRLNQLLNSQHIPIYRDSIIVLHYYIASFYEEIDNYDAAIAYWKQLLQFKKKYLNDPHSLAYDENSIGNDYKAEGNHEKAQEYYSRSLQHLNQPTK